MPYKVLLARAMQSLGILWALESCKPKPGILVINHHRIGDAHSTSFDRGVFSATADELDAQLRYFKQRAPIVTGEELEELVSGRTKMNRLHVAFTFDDGYLDNYTKAFDVVRSADSTATFFLVTDYVGTATVPWWDEIAYLVRNTSKAKVSLVYPVPLKISLNGERESSIATVLQHYKRADNIRSDEFMDGLRHETECELPAPKRRFLDWNEARRMRDAGMAIGSHTNSHAILGRLPQELQRLEMEGSKRQIESHIGGKVRALAYPVGARDCFSEATERMALSAGYSMCFSSYGGVNGADDIKRSNLLRGSVPSNPYMFRAATTLITRLGLRF